jgi:hypothetical protein
LLWNDETRQRARTTGVTLRRTASTQRPNERRDAP